MFSSLNIFVILLTFWLNLLDVQAMSKDYRNFQVTKDQRMYETYNAYWHNPNQANQMADFRAKAIEEKQVQVKQLSNHFKELTTNKSTNKKDENVQTKYTQIPAKTQTPSEMDKALKDKLYQTVITTLVFISRLLDMALAENDTKPQTVNGIKQGNKVKIRPSSNKIDTSKVYWASPEMIKAKKFIPVERYQSRMNKKNVQSNTITSTRSSDEIHTQHNSPSAQLSQASKVIGRRPSNIAQTKVEHDVGTNFKQYELFPKDKKQNEFFSF